MIDLVGFKIKLFHDLEADASDVELCLLFANHFSVRVLPFFAPVLYPLLTADSLWHVFVNAAPGFRAGSNLPVGEQTAPSLIATRCVVECASRHAVYTHCPGETQTGGIEGPPPKCRS